MEQKNIYARRLASVREAMGREGITVSLFYSTDPHGSEYLCEHDRITEYISGCTSDNVTLVIGRDCAKLWTDGRYFISAAEELGGTGIELMKMGEKDVPSPGEFLGSILHAEDTLAFDGRYVSARRGSWLRRIAEKCGADVNAGADLISGLWKERPPLPAGRVRVLPMELSGCSAMRKLGDVRKSMAEKGAESCILSRLDEIMWLLNIRGTDVPCNPVALSYLLLNRETGFLFLQKDAVTAGLVSAMEEVHVEIRDYTEFYDFLRSYSIEGPVLCDPDASCDALYGILKNRAEVTEAESPVLLRKAVKNPVEIENSVRSYLEDSVQVCRFLYRMKQPGAAAGMTEYSAARMMDSLRAEIPGFAGTSFPTIAATGPNAAMAHYEPSPEGSAPLKEEGFLLVDSGGQYEGGTTDVTRTIAMGPLTAVMKRDFTLTACANLALMYTRFAAGTTGSQLDMIAREKLWKYGLDYNHGTGHGVGYMLNVHEGPQRIGAARPNLPDPPMKPGMITSDEPGVYREGLYGIRTESILLTVADGSSEFGEFLCFRPLTLAPIDLDGLDPAYMEAGDVERLNRYHRTVREKISPFLDENERAWLAEATCPM